MNKYILLGVLVFAIVGMTLIADSATNLDPSYVAPSESLEEDRPAEIDNTVGSVFSFINTWFKMATFSLEGFPAWITAMLFLPLNFMALYMIVDIVKDLIPFT